MRMSGDRCWPRCTRARARVWRVRVPAVFPAPRKFPSPPPWKIPFSRTAVRRRKAARRHLVVSKRGLHACERSRAEDGAAGMCGAIGGVWKLRRDGRWRPLRALGTHPIGCRASSRAFCICTASVRRNAGPMSIARSTRASLASGTGELDKRGGAKECPKRAWATRRLEGTDGRTATRSGRGGRDADEESTKARRREEREREGKREREKTEGTRRSKERDGGGSCGCEVPPRSHRVQRARGDEKKKNIRNNGAGGACLPA